MQVAAAHLAALRRSLSNERLDAYRVTSSEPEIDLHARYLWNLALAESLHPLLHCLEVGLRNALHGAISATHGPRWYDLPTLLVDSWGRDKVREAKATLTRAGKPLDPGRMVAELDFGFWTSLLNIRYARQARTPPSQSPLWPTFTQATFPYFPLPGRNPAAGRPALSRRFNSIRQHLRNRISHHEPIWRGWLDRSTGRFTPVTQQHADVLEAIQWMSAALHDTVARLDRFPQVYTAGAVPYRAILATFP